MAKFRQLDLILFFKCDLDCYIMIIVFCVALMLRLSLIYKASALGFWLV